MDALATESWSWYAITWVVVAARILSQRLLRGAFKKLQADDVLIIFAMLADTVLMVSMNIISHTNSNLINPDDHAELTPESIREREFGSKMVLVVEQMQMLTTWTVKSCLLLLYNRLTQSLPENMVVKIVAGYVVAGFLLMEILYLGVWCRPFSEYWAVPPDNVQCSAATNHLITNAVLNISSDLIIILLPMPLLIKSHLSLKKKFILGGVFTLGAFTILSAILNKYYSFSQPFGLNWTFWYIRESSTALITANLPLVWPLIRQIFNIGAFGGQSSNHRSGNVRSRFRTDHTRNHSAGKAARNPEVDRSASQERINNSFPLKIYCHHDYEVQSRRSSAENDGVSSLVHPVTEASSTAEVISHGGTER